jgi:phosphoribosylaminoimidazolecarboxamide formyltransferase/IMP cyclohydrolase
MDKRIKAALISVYHKERLEELVGLLNKLSIRIYSTGGTFRFISDRGINAMPVEDITSYPSILGGRVKTLHPAIFGGILYRRDNDKDLADLEEYNIPPIDLVIVDLYPFEQTVASSDDEQEIIEKIDIGGISLIRAGAKNFEDVLIIPSRDYYDHLIRLLNEKMGLTSREDRLEMAKAAFNVSSHYDTAIYKYFGEDSPTAFKESIVGHKQLRYGENPHQKGSFFGDLSEVFEQLHGKEISYNNLGDLEAAIDLIQEFDEPTIAILKHNNPCGLASRNNLPEAWKDALAGDPISAFGGVIAANREIDEVTAQEINKLFFEIIIAPSFQKKAMELLQTKKNRIILRHKGYNPAGKRYRSLLNGVIVQDRDNKTETGEDLKSVTKNKPDSITIEDLLFANKIVKHTKSNAIVLARDKQLIGSGIGQTSRVDALKQAIAKARAFELDLDGGVMASDAFFPFADSVEIAHKSGIVAVIQPGGSVRDQDSIDYCDKAGMTMVFTGTRHFKH